MCVGVGVNLHENDQRLDIYGIFEQLSTWRNWVRTIIKGNTGVTPESPFMVYWITHKGTIKIDTKYLNLNSTAPSLLPFKLNFPLICLFKAS